jgi:hypothetical protein
MWAVAWLMPLSCEFTTCLDFGITGFADLIVTSEWGILLFCRDGSWCGLAKWVFMLVFMLTCCLSFVLCWLLLALWLVCSIGLNSPSGLLLVVVFC